MLSRLLYVLSAAVALAAAFHAHGGYGPLSLSWAAWLAWIVLPYVVMGATSIALRRSPQRPALQMADAAGALAVLAGTIVFYRALWFGPHHSTEGLVFIFAPAFLLIAGLVAFGIMYAIARERPRGGHRVP